MSVAKKIRNKTESMTGRTKKGIGKATNNRSLEAKGKAQQVAGNVKQSGQKLRDAAKK